MNFHTFNIFNWKKPELSEFYISVIFSFFLFQLIQPIIVMISRWLIDALQALFNFQTGINQVWYSLFIVCFILTIIIMQYVIVPLGLKIDKQSSSSWETLLTFLLVFGFFIFMLNQVFEAVNMPGDWPIWLLRTFGGYDKLNLDLVDNSNRNFWSFIPWIWLLGPILVFYWPVLKEGAFGGGSSSKKDS